ncbi:hypothetical protein [Streptomyces sp. SAS_275]|uniref:hypothetical protein n=1 Tax=Streptomyces sp. SAS_275 TaxID=3412746 RepID=UPI00403C71C6
MSSNPNYGDVYDHKTFNQSAIVTDLYTTGHGPTVGLEVTNGNRIFSAALHVEMLDATYAKRK